MKHWNDERTDALDARIDAGLERSFPPPERLEFRLPDANHAPAGSGPARWLAAAGIAAVLGGFAWRTLSTSQGVDGTRTTTEVASLAPVTGIPERPDLMNLYDSIQEIPRPVVGCDSEPESFTGGVEDTLASRCGAEIELPPDAASLLVGPFSSDEWPSGTVLAGYPDGPDEAPVVIVAECADYQDCCIDLGAASALGLQHFSANVGGVALTEITPHAEPRMLGLLAAWR